MGADRAALPAARRAHRAVLACQLAILALTANWFIWYAPPERVPRALLLILFALPLALTLRGVLAGQPRSYIATALIALWLFAAGIDIAFYVADWSALGGCLCALSLALFLSCYQVLRARP